MDNPVLAYIKDNLKKGYSKKSILKKLEESGYDDATINLYFNEATKKIFPVNILILFIALGVIVLAVFLVFHFISFNTPSEFDTIPKNDDNNPSLEDLSQNISVSSESDDLVRNTLSVLPPTPDSEETHENLTESIKILDETFNKECIEKECIPFEAHLYVTAYTHLGYDIPDSSKENLRLMVERWKKYYMLNYNREDPYLKDPREQIGYVISLEAYLGYPKEEVYYEWEPTIKKVNFSADSRLLITSVFENSTISDDLMNIFKKA
jgi:hypothetical protein